MVGCGLRETKVETVASSSGEPSHDLTCDSETSHCLNAVYCAVPLQSPDDAEGKCEMDKRRKRVQLRSLIISHVKRIVAFLRL